MGGPDYKPDRRFFEDRFKYLHSRLLGSSQELHICTAEWMSSIPPLAQQVVSSPAEPTFRVTASGQHRCSSAVLCAWSSRLQLGHAWHCDVASHAKLACPGNSYAGCPAGARAILLFCWQGQGHLHMKVVWHNCQAPAAQGLKPMCT